MGKIEVVVLDHDSDSVSEPFDSTLNAAIEMLTKARDRIPVEFQSDARFEINSHSDESGCDSAQVKVWYRRPETEAELLMREQERQAALIAYQQYAQTQDSLSLLGLKPNTRVPDHG